MYIRVSKAADILGVSRAAVDKMCDTGKLDHKLDEKKKRVVNKSDVLNFALARDGKNKAQEKEPESENKQTSEISLPQEIEAQVENYPAPLMDDHPYRRAGKFEIDRLVKVEDAIKRNRENLIADGKLIETSRLHEVIEKVFSDMAAALREYVDHATIKSNLTSAQADEMRRAFDDKIKSFLGQIKHAVR